MPNQYTIFLFRFFKSSIKCSWHTAASPLHWRYVFFGCFRRALFCWNDVLHIPCCIYCTVCVYISVNSQLHLFGIHLSFMHHFMWLFSAVWCWKGSIEGGKGQSEEQRLQRWCDKRFIAQQSPSQLGPLQPLYITSSSLPSSQCRGREFVYMCVSKKYRPTETETDTDRKIELVWW